MAVIGPPNPENRLKLNEFDKTVRKLYSNVKQIVAGAPVQGNTHRRIRCTGLSNDPRMLQEFGY
jgi:hypothetical protein